jgi:hypothetical protein
MPERKNRRMKKKRRDEREDWKMNRKSRKIRKKWRNKGSLVLKFVEVVATLSKNWIVTALNWNITRHVTHKTLE